MEMLERLWEGTGLFFSGVTQSIERGITNLFGSSNARQVKRLQSRVEQINALESKLAALTDEELRNQTAKFRARLREGETLDDILVEAFASCREAGKRYLRMRHYDVQLIGGMVLHQGMIAEMVTGEGKTLVATLPAYLNAIEGRGVHVVTVNDYLARRDMEWMAPLYMGLGLTVGTIQSGMDGAERQASYACDITYGTNNEFGFDYLRDNMRVAARGDNRYSKSSQQVQGPLHYAIIDEVDNILIDEARTPLIISGPAELDLGKYSDADRIARQLERDKHFTVNEKDHNVTLTDEGVRQAEKLAGVESFYTAGNMEWPHLLDNSLKAHHLYKRDVNYVVREDAIIIVDEFTGRLMEGRQWSDGLHQAVEAKERVKIKDETQTLATITLQNFFKLYKKISGMTGTAMTEANEFWKIYKLDVVAIPTNRGLQRIEYPDAIYLTEKEKFQCVADDVERAHKWDSIVLKDGTEKTGTIDRETESEIFFIPQGEKKTESISRSQITKIEPKGRPVLVGTVSIEKSERLSHLLDIRGIKHQVLNAKQHRREAEIIAQAGRRFAVTIATNMAGRGTDIILGGNPETLAWARLQDKYPTRLEVPKEEWDGLVHEIEQAEQMKAQGELVRSLGGLYVIGTERHESRRIDLQLRGRCGRQGDPGSSRFFLSLEDDLMRIFAGDWVRAWMSKLGMGEGERIESPFVSRRIAAAQKKVEERNFEVRKNLLEYDEVMDQQRKRVYSYRQQILEGASCRQLIIDQLVQQTEHYVGEYLSPLFGPESFAKLAAQKLSCKLDGKDFRGQDSDAATSYAHEVAERAAETQVLDAIEENLPSSEDESEWNWQALCSWFNARYNASIKPNDIRKIPRDRIDEDLIAMAHKQLALVDISDGYPYLDHNYGLQTALKWLANKFGIQVNADELKSLEPNQIVKKLVKTVESAYDRREAEFPVFAALSHCSRQVAQGQFQIDREQLAQWAARRYESTELAELVLNGDPDKIFDELVAASRQMTVRASEARNLAESKLQSLFGNSMTGTKVRELSGSDSAVNELQEWLAKELKHQVDKEEFKQLTREEVKAQISRAIDDRFYPEMRGMERSLLLSIVDESWKNHLLAMDHLRSSVGLKGYAQIDPKVEYKREGVRLFEQMWFSIGERMTDLVFRIRTELEGPSESTFVETSARHDEASSTAEIARQQAASREAASQQAARQQAIEQSDSPVRVDPIRSRNEKVGRNDPCPCGSGKKYKNCCLRKEPIA